MKKEFHHFINHHCDLKQPGFKRGEKYAENGAVLEAEHSHHSGGSIIGSVHYEAMDTDNKLIINLRDLGHMLRFLYEGKGSQKRILIILNENETGSITQRELTQRLGVKPGSASEVISKLEDSGLIQRTPSTEDRRTADIQLTQAGKKLAEEAAAERKSRHREMFSCLSQEEKETLLSLLEKVNSDWSNRYSPDEEHRHHMHHDIKGHHGHHIKHHK